MRYCFQCNRVTAGEPLFCNRCGSSYDVKLCSRLHPNPRHAEVCAQCGSRDLSNPQPRVPFWGRALLTLGPWLIGIPLALATVVAGLEIVSQLVTTREFQAGIAALVILMALLWFMWSQLPDWIRKFIHRAIAKSRHGGNRTRRGEP